MFLLPFLGLLGRRLREATAHWRTPPQPLRGPEISESDNTPTAR
jgi:hypothetical protein